MKYTPGPWEAKNVENAGGDICVMSKRGYVAIACTRNEGLINAEANARLIATAPDLLEEHIQWGKILGHILVAALQNDYEALDIYKKHIKLDYRDGEPFIQSKAISMAEKEE